MTDLPSSSASPADVWRRRGEGPALPPDHIKAAFSQFLKKARKKDPLFALAEAEA